MLIRRTDILFEWEKSELWIFVFERPVNTRNDCSTEAIQSLRLPGEGIRRSVLLGTNLSYETRLPS